MTKTKRVRAWLLEHPGRYTIRQLCRELRDIRLIAYPTGGMVYRALCSLRDSGAAEKWGGGRTTTWRVYAEKKPAHK